MKVKQSEKKPKPPLENHTFIALKKKKKKEIQSLLLQKYICTHKISKE